MTRQRARRRRGRAAREAAGACSAVLRAVGHAQTCSARARKRFNTNRMWWHRRLGLLAVTAGSVLMIATGGASGVSARPAGAEAPAAPFAQAWGHVPRAPAARRAKSLLAC